MVRGRSVEGKLICDNSSGPRPTGLFKDSVFDAGPRGGDDRLEDVDDGTAERFNASGITPVPASNCFPGQADRDGSMHPHEAGAGCTHLSAYYLFSNDEGHVAANIGN